MNAVGDDALASKRRTRRRMLQTGAAVGAAAWASPSIQSVSVFAACVPRSVQFDGNGTPQTTSLSSSDGGGAAVCSPCDPSGADTAGTALFFAPGQGPNGSATDGSMSGLVYTAPAGCAIIQATGRRFDPGGISGCDYACDVVSSTGLTVTFPGGSGTYIAFRILLCC